MTILLTVVLSGIIVVSGALGLSSLIVLSR